MTGATVYGGGQGSGDDRSTATVNLKPQWGRLGGSIS